MCTFITLCNSYNFQYIHFNGPLLFSALSSHNYVTFTANNTAIDVTQERKLKKHLIQKAKSLTQSLVHCVQMTAFVTATNKEELS